MKVIDANFFSISGRRPNLVVADQIFIFVIIISGRRLDSNKVFDCWIYQIRVKRFKFQEIVQSECDFMPARASPSLSLFNFTHLWFRFHT